MEQISKLEDKIAPLFKDMPRLPLHTREWLAMNIWWITLVGVIITAIAVVGLLSVTVLAGVFLGFVGGIAGAAVGGVLFIAALFSISFLVVMVLLGILAVNPLRELQKKGWTLLFVVLLLRAAELVVSFLFKFNLISLIWGLLVTAIGLYLLFEIRSLFKASTGRKITTAKVIENKP